MSDPDISARSTEAKSERELNAFDYAFLELEQLQGEQQVPCAQDKIIHDAFSDSQRLPDEQHVPFVQDKITHDTSPDSQRLQGEQGGPPELKQVQESNLRTSNQNSVTHRKRVQDELMRSRHAIRLLLSQSADWSLLSSEERELGWQKTWIERAQRYETEKIAKYGLDSSDFDFSQNGRLDVLDRQRRVLWRIVGKKNPLSCDATASELQAHRAYLLIELNHRQLELLESWTMEWQHLVSNCEQVSRSESQRNTTPFRESRRHVGEPSESTADGRHVSPYHPTQMHGKPHGWADSSPPRQYETSATQETFQLETGQASATYPLFESNHDTIWTQGRAQALQSQPSYGGYEQPSIPGNQFVGSLNDLPGFNLQDFTHGPLPGPGFAASPSPASFSDGSAAQIVMMPSPAPHPPTPPSRGQQPKKRGAPRLRMFITKPASETPLPQEALDNDIEVLENFPEHLSLAGVMRRFVRIGRTGGWATERMVDILEKHPNAKDHPDISKESRRANLKKWVIKERDRCNEYLRKASSTAATEATPEVDHAGPPSRAENEATQSLPPVSSASSARVEPMENAIDSTFRGTILQSPFNHANENMTGPVVDLQGAEALEFPNAQEEHASVAFGSPFLPDGQYEGLAKPTGFEESVDWAQTFEEIMETFD